MKKVKVKKEYVYYFERYSEKLWLLFKRKRNKVIYVFEVIKGNYNDQAYFNHINYNGKPLTKDLSKFALEWQYIKEIGPYSTWKALYGKKEENSNI